MALVSLARLAGPGQRQVTALRRLVRPLLVSVAAGLGLYAAAMIGADVETMSGAAARLGLLGWLVVLGLSLFNYLARFVRWDWYLEHLGDRVPRLPHVAYYFAGLAFATTPGKAGEAVRSLYLRRHGVAFSHSLAALFVERVADVATMVLLALLAAWSYAGARWPVLVAGGLVFGVLGLARSPGTAAWMDRRRDGLPWPRIGVLLGHLATLLRDSAELLRARVFYAGLLLGLVAWGAEGLGFYLILDRLETGVSLSAAVGIYAVGILVGALSFIPGGLGSTEGAMVLLLGVAGVGTGEAVAATLICRIATLWFGVAVGFVSILGLESAGLGLGRAGSPEAQP